MSLVEIEKEVKEDVDTAKMVDYLTKFHEVKSQQRIDYLQRRLQNQSFVDQLYNVDVEEQIRLITVSDLEFDILSVYVNSLSKPQEKVAITEPVEVRHSALEYAGEVIRLLLGNTTSVDIKQKFPDTRKIPL